jgi:hypothetical protein
MNGVIFKIEFEKVNDKVGWPFLLEICQRGNNKIVIIYIFVFMINVYIPCYNSIIRKQ